MKTNNKAITSFLIFLLIGVWGAIVYQLFIAGSSQESGDALREVSGKTGITKTPIKYEYITNVRDPFGLVVPLKKKLISKKVAAPPLPVWTPPPFKLTGIVVNDRKRTAMLESNDGAIYFLREGDSLGQLKMLMIKKNMVAYQYVNEKHFWNLDK
jgi:hypothetical protein